MGNLQAIPATKCEDRMKNINTGNIDNNLSNRCEGLNPENVYNTLYPQNPTTSSNKQKEMMMPKWLESYYKNYPKEGKPGDYRCKYSAINQSCTQISQTSCPSKKKDSVVNDVPIKPENNLQSTSRRIRTGTQNAPKIRVNHIGFNNCQIGGDNKNCLHDIYTVNSFGFPTSHGKPNPPLNTTMYSKPYNVINGKFAVACPSDSNFGTSDSNIGCFGKFEPIGCMPTFYPFPIPVGQTPVSNQCDKDLANEMYFSNYEGNIPFEATQQQCQSACNSKGSACSGYATYQNNGKTQCVLYKQEQSILNNNMYSVSGANSLLKNLGSDFYPSGPVSDALPVKTVYKSINGPLLYCPKDYQEISEDSYGNVYCGSLDESRCRSAYDPYSKDISKARPGICSGYTSSDFNYFFANKQGEVSVNNEGQCKSLCDYNPNCTGYSFRNVYNSSDIQIKGEHYCTLYSVPSDKMRNITLSSDLASGTITKTKLVGGCPGTLVRDNGGNCVMNFNDQLLGNPSSSYMAGIPLGGGIKRGIEPDPRSGTAFMEYF